MAILIKNGTIVNDDDMFRADVLIKNDKICEIGKYLAVPEYTVVLDASNRFVIPGGIDPHTHLQLPFAGTVSIDDFFTGTAAALAGGTTMVSHSGHEIVHKNQQIIDFAVTLKDQMPLDTYKQWRAWADPKVCCDYALTAVISSWNDEVAKQMELLATREYGINSFKFYMAYEQLMISDEDIFQGLIQCSRLGAIARVHAENGKLIAEKAKRLLADGITGPEGHILCRPEEESEVEATNRACALAKRANCPLYVVHVMSKGAAEAISYHRRNGAIVFGEPLAAGLTLDGSHYYNKDFMHAAGHVMSPPLSLDPTTPSALMDLLALGQLDLTATDNCSFTCRQKEAGRGDFTKIPSGLNGLEDRMSVIWEKGVVTGKMDPKRFVQVTSSTAAKIFNIYPRKGRISVGSDADIVIWNPNGEKMISKETHHQACDFNVFEGMKVTGIAETTISRGKIVWHNGQLNVSPGTGRFIHLAPFSPFVF